MKKHFRFGIVILLITSSLLFFGQKSLFANRETIATLISHNTFSYNATSPYELFNETKDPRYTLVARPLDLIRFPNKGYPAIIAEGEKLTVKVEAPENTINWSFTLVSDANNLSTQIDHIDRNGTAWSFQLIINDFQLGLYDLMLNCSAGFDYQTHAVKLISQRSYPITFAHISDLHFPAYSEDINTTDINLRTIDAIKSQNLDFVICTGDVIQGPTLVFADPVSGKSVAAEVQLKLALWALDKLDMPVFIIAGNHDLDTSTLLPDDPRTVWKGYMGPPIMNFSYLDWRFTGFGSSFEGLTPDEMSELNAILSAYDGSPITLFYHYNFRSQAASVISKHSVALALYGHEHQEKLYMKSGTLYHCQAPMFEEAYSIFNIINETAAEFNNKIYEFSEAIHRPENIQTTTPFTTSEAELSAVYLISVILFVPIAKALWRKTNKKTIQNNLTFKDQL